MADDSLRTIKNAYGGANKKYRDLFNMNIDRDYNPDIQGDVAMAKSDFLSPNGKGKLIEKRGIEVGNIFQLGLHYSKKMKGATFIDKTGKEKPYYMGCYGIGLGRTLATIVEQFHDERGITWPSQVAPYHVHLIGLDFSDENVKKRAFELYEKLQKDNIEVLFDEREDVSPGAKFADADLIGNPIRLVVSKRTGDKIEFKRRNENKNELLTYEEVIKKIKELNI